MDERSDTIGSRISKFRLANGLTQSELADLVGVTQGRVSRWENDDIVPDPGSLRALSVALKVLPRDLAADAETRRFLAPDFQGNPKPLSVDDISVTSLYLIVGDGREPLEMLVNYQHEPLQLVPKLRKLYPKLAHLVRERAHERGAAFWDGPIIRLNSISERASRQDSSGYEKRVVELNLGPVSWTEFSALNTLLDEAGFFETNRGLTLRDAFVEPAMLYAHPTDFSWCPLSNMLTICMMPVTADGYGIIQRRSSSVSATPRLLISGVSENTHRWLDESPANNLWHRLHGLVPAKDLANMIGANYAPASGNVPSPFLTVLRGMQEELADLPPATEAAERRIKFLSVCMDLKLFQPVLTGIIEVPYSGEEVRPAIKRQLGKDHSEWTELELVKLSSSDFSTRKLLQDTHSWDIGGLGALMMAIRYVESRAHR